MYLKAVEIQGFKSFPQKIHLSFDKPVTGIVGPNGSGKSNISDAIRWVMGEQSTKTLRGGKMEDVIFGGTERRSPLGFAEVSLIIDNSERIFDTDSAEVMVTRRYYRSGDSEYYINKQAVRLKDVNELFMDTGLGRDGYSIIGQGRIDEILSVKSADRREIFEEAAGISRFRHRKEESERKLERAEENLVRVNDKIAELELQVGPLRDQAAVAKKYLILRDELRGLEITLWAEGLSRLAELSREIGAERTAAGAQLESANAELEALYASGEEYAAKTREKDIEAERVRGDAAACENRAAELESAGAVLRANLRSNRENIERIGRDIEAQDGRNAGLRAQIDERRGRMKEIEAESELENGRLADLSEAADRLSGSADAAAGELAELLRSENANLEAAAADRARLTSLSEQLQELEDRSTALLRDAGEAGARLGEIKTAREECADKLKKASDEAQSVRNMISGYKLRLESRRKKADAASEKKTKLTIELGSVRSRAAMLTEMEKEYEGYSRAVKTVMQESARGALKNIRGPVAELLHTDERYSVAIETALGPAMQNIIVDTEEDGKAAISLLKRRDAGRATFLPVSAIRGRTLDERGLNSEPGFIGAAIELVEFNESYTNVYSSLLGRTAVADTLDAAVRIARKYGNRFRIVTLDGQVINAGGSMTGGSASKSAGILSRANELKRLAESERLLAGDLSEAARLQDEAARELDAAEYELAVASDELRPLEDEILKLKSDTEHYFVLFSAAEAASESAKTESGSVAEKIKSAEKDIDSLRKSLALHETEDARLKAAIAEKTEGTRDIDDERARVFTETSETRGRLASLGAERAAIELSVGELESLVADLSGGGERQRAVLEGMERQNADIEAEIAERERERAEKTAEAEKFRARVSEVLEEKLQIEAERSKRDRETQEKNKALLELERDAAALEQKALSAELEEKQLVDKLWETYELSRSDAMAQRLALESVPAAQKRASELKREISKLGTPNLGAIEEFERVNTRYTYLTEQRDDIDKAKNELNTIIGDITNEMSDIFAREFREINDSFAVTFTELFGGGRAALELDDPADILNCGIEIKVQPPGKALKTITLLSGGEKAFVAIALYFAILKIRPTPFVVMDEIEAALDDANVVRYADYMRRMTDKTQFLVITHRRHTMEEADVLYGVTMQEQGVSQVLTVDLDEAEKTLAK